MRLRPTYVSAERAEGLSPAGGRWAVNQKGSRAEIDTENGRRRWWQSPRSVGRRVGADTRATTQRQNRGHESNFERGPAWHKISTNTHAKKCSPRCWMPEIGNSYSYLVMHLCVSLPFPLLPSPALSPFLNRISPPPPPLFALSDPLSPFLPGSRPILVRARGGELEICSGDQLRGDRVGGRESGADHIAE